MGVVFIIHRGTESSPTSLTFVFDLGTDSTNFPGGKLAVGAHARVSR